MSGRMWAAAAALALLGAACAAPAPAVLTATPSPEVVLPLEGATPLPTRTAFPPGELVPYLAQSGDTLPAVAAHFNTTVDEILAANPNVPADVTTLPPGYPMQIPAYYQPLTGSPLHILPDSEVVNGPGAVGFDVRQEIERRTGFIAGLSDYAYRRERPAWDVVQSVAVAYSIHPRLLLTLLEHRTQALTLPFAEGDGTVYPLGYPSTRYRGLFRQLLWVAERLNEGYYGWRSGRLKEFETSDGLIVRPDPWLNAGTVAVQYALAGMLPKEEFEVAVSPAGLFTTYVRLWGDPFALAVELIPGNLQQPELGLPFLPNRIWEFTGGPHSSWGTTLPWGALDFAPPAVATGCAESGEWIAAPAAGVIVRSRDAAVVLDLDGDADDRTGWSLFFYHVSDRDRTAAGTELERGGAIGHPSCEGGQASGTHFHVARRYNGEWLSVIGPPAFVLDGWVPTEGNLPYVGTLVKGSITVPACDCTSAANRILYQFP
ncbi:MAG TPA: LysM domain-containing protein [Anaerolineales bacterium]